MSRIAQRFDMDPNFLGGSAYSNAGKWVQDTEGHTLLTMCNDGWKRTELSIVGCIARRDFAFYPEGSYITNPESSFESAKYVMRLQKPVHNADLDDLWNLAIERLRAKIGEITASPVGFTSSFLSNSIVPSPANTSLEFTHQLFKPRTSALDGNILDITADWPVGLEHQSALEAILPTREVIPLTVRDKNGFFIAPQHLQNQLYKKIIRLKFNLNQKFMMATDETKQSIHASMSELEVLT